MAGTNAVAFKTALVSLLKTALATAGEGGRQVRVDDAYSSKNVEREYVYIGKILGPQAPMAFRAGARLPREENLTVDIHVEVEKPAAPTAETDARFVAIGTLIEEAIANDPLFGGTVTGLMGAWMSHSQLTSFYLEDGKAATEGIYQITVQSRLG